MPDNASWTVAQRTYDLKWSPVGLRMTVVERNGRAVYEFPTGDLTEYSSSRVGRDSVIRFRSAQFGSFRFSVPFTRCAQVDLWFLPLVQLSTEKPTVAA